MDQMSETEMQQALEHDAAIKGNNGGAEGVATAGEEAPTVQTLVPAEVLLDGLEIKQAALAKSVSLSYTDVAQACAALVLNDLRPGVDTKDLEKEPPTLDMEHLEHISKVMDIAAYALKLAGESDVLGDKAVVRMPAPAPEQAE